MAITLYPDPISCLMLLLLLAFCGAVVTFVCALLQLRPQPRAVYVNIQYRAGGEAVTDAMGDAPPHRPRAATLTDSNENLSNITFGRQMVPGNDEGRRLYILRLIFFSDDTIYIRIDYA